MFFSYCYHLCLSLTCSPACSSAWRSRWRWVGWSASRPRLNNKENDPCVRALSWQLLCLTYVCVAFDHHNPGHCLWLAHSQGHSPEWGKVGIIFSDNIQVLWLFIDIDISVSPGLTCVRTPEGRRSPWISEVPPESRPSLGCHSHRTPEPPRGVIWQFVKFE